MVYGRVGLVETGQHVGLAHHLHDVGRMAAARAFGVEGVDGAALEGGEGVFDKARFVERVGVDGDLHVGLVGHVQAVVDGGGRGAPVFVQLQADGAGLDLLDAAARGRLALPLPRKPRFIGKASAACSMRCQVPGAGRAGGGIGAGGRAGAAADHGGDAAGQRFFDLLRADEVDVGVDAAGGDDDAFAGDDFGAGADDDVHAGLDVGVAGLADAGDAARPSGRCRP